MQRRAISQFAQRLTHLREDQLRFIAQREKSFGAAKFFALSRHSQNFVGSHRVGAWLAGIAAECAVAAIIAAKIGQRNENFARVSDYTRLESITGGAST